MTFSDCDIDGAGHDRWLSFIGSHPLASVFHHPAWHEVIEKTYGIRARYLLKTENGMIISALPYARVKNIFGRPRLVSFPFSDSCDPLTREGSTVAELLKGSLAEDAPNIEIRADSSDIDGFPAACSYVNSVLRLEGGQDRVYAALHNDCVRRMIKKAERKCVRVVEGLDDHMMREYYTLHALTRKRQGSPVQPLSFFKNIVDVFKESGLARVYLAGQARGFTAGIIILRFKDTAFYKFGASLSEYSSTGHNQLLMWTAIKDSIDSGLKYFDFGRTFQGDAGLLEYKSRWGAVKRQMRYAYYPEPFKRLNDEDSLAKKLAKDIFRWIPAGSNMCLGRFIYKYLA